MAIIGAILGDIAGSPFEFQHAAEHLAKRKANEYKLFNRAEDFYEFTDDTVMSIATMEALETDRDFARCYRKWGTLYPHMSYGVRFLDWLGSSNMPAYNSLGNGSAMRIAYCADKYSELQDVYDAATESAKVTHNHEEGIKGAGVTALCIAMARQGASKEEILEYASKEYPSSKYRYGCDKPLNEFIDMVVYSETCMDSVPLAIRCFYETDSFEECCRKIISMPVDTDTICAIAGPICEEFYGSCLGSKEKDEAMLRAFLSKQILDLLEEYKVIGG